MRTVKGLVRSLPPAKGMSQRDVERALGRLLTDASFRRAFFRNPGRACLEAGIQLAAPEVDALLGVPIQRLASLAGQLDDRICRLDIEDENHDSSASR